MGGTGYVSDGWMVRDRPRLADLDFGESPQLPTGSKGVGDAESRVRAKSCGRFSNGGLASSTGSSLIGKKAIRSSELRLGVGNCDGDGNWVGGDPGDKGPDVRVPKLSRDGGNVAGAKAVDGKRESKSGSERDWNPDIGIGIEACSGRLGGCPRDPSTIWAKSGSNPKSKAFEKDHADSGKEVAGVLAAGLIGGAPKSSSSCCCC
ncbi:hypothetical protein HK101_010763 [Irineochytrium annulatum]|nr:hypothetical protein HK101_010763 [Irineochytrium annulatum]